MHVFPHCPLMAGSIAGRNALPVRFSTSSAHSHFSITKPLSVRANLSSPIWRERTSGRRPAFPLRAEAGDGSTETNGTEAEIEDGQAREEGEQNEGEMTLYIRTMTYSRVAVWIALCAILPSLGLIRLEDFGFPVFWGVYLAAANYFRFDGNKKFKDVPQEAALDLPWIKPYILLLAVSAMLLPAITMALNYQNQDLLLTYAPPLFLLACQILFEVLSRVTNSAVMVQLLVVVGFNAWRLTAIWEWFVQSSVFGGWHTALAGLNLLLWMWNLLVVLFMYNVPFYLDDRRCAT